MLVFLKQWWKRLGGASKAPSVRVIPRSEHILSRSRVSPSALKVLYRLHHSGYQAYLVGGCVRDVLLGHAPKDFDVATDARPEQVRHLFRNARVIGRRFKLVHVRFKDEIIEVSTFRGGPAPAQQKKSETGRVLQDNVYGTLEEDVWRRDFTVNALYYNIADFSLVDHVGALRDIETRTLRVIGNPSIRYREDPVRMLRAVRFANKLGFHLDQKNISTIQKLAPLVCQVPGSRLFEEWLKLFSGSLAHENYRMMRTLLLWQACFPALEEILRAQPEDDRWLLGVFQQDASLESPEEDIALRIAWMAWPMVRGKDSEHLSMAGDAYVEHCNHQLRQLSPCIIFPKRYTELTREIFLIQPRLRRKSQKSSERLMRHPFFSLGFRFLEKWMTLDAEAGEAYAFWRSLKARKKKRSLPEA